MLMPLLTKTMISKKKKKKVKYLPDPSKFSQVSVTDDKQLNLIVKVD